METVMSEEEKLCAHIPCQCVVGSDEKYCSQACEDAGSSDVEIACECGHESCVVEDVEEEEENVA
jgi:hypothetical protein